LAWERKALQKEKCWKINFSFGSFPQKNEPYLKISKGVEDYE
jgi:hypothetical protein